MYFNSKKNSFTLYMYYTSMLLYILKDILHKLHLWHFDNIYIYIYALNIYLHLFI